MKLTVIVVVLIIISIILWTCIGTKPEKENVVRSKCKEYLKSKYNKEFKILQFKQFFHGGHWKYETDIEAVPVDDQLITFWLKYDAKKKSVKGDEYKRAFWEHQIEQELKPIVDEEYELLEFNARLSRNGSIAFLNSDMEFYPNYHEMISNIKLPVLHLTIRIAGIPKADESDVDCFIKLSEILSNTAFVKSEFSVYFYDKAILNNEQNNFSTNSNSLDKSFCKKQLLFKITNRLRVPQKEDIIPLLIDYKSDSLFKNNQLLFEEAEKNRQNGNEKDALELYLKIVSSVSDYRYSSYAPSEAAYSIESAFYAARILEKQNKMEQAMELYNEIIKRMEYEEVKLNLSDYYNKAKRRIEEEEK